MVKTSDRKTRPSDNKTGSSNKKSQVYSGQCLTFKAGKGYFAKFLHGSIP